MRTYDEMNDLYFPKRSYPRYKVDATTSVLYNGDSRNNVIVKDLSSRGSCIVSKTPLMKNQIVGLSFNPPLFDYPVRRKAKVVWTKEIETGMYYSGVDFGLPNKIQL